MPSRASSRRNSAVSATSKKSSNKKQRSKSASPRRPKSQQQQQFNDPNESSHTCFVCQKSSGESQLVKCSWSECKNWAHLADPKKVSPKPTTRPWMCSDVKLAPDNKRKGGGGGQEEKFERVFKTPANQDRRTLPDLPPFIKGYFCSGTCYQKAHGDYIHSMYVNFGQDCPEVEESQELMLYKPKLHHQDGHKALVIATLSVEGLFRSRMEIYQLLFERCPDLLVVTHSDTDMYRKIIKDEYATDLEPYFEMQPTYEMYMSNEQARGGIVVYIKKTVFEEEAADIEPVSTRSSEIQLTHGGKDYVCRIDQHRLRLIDNRDIGIAVVFVGDARHKTKSSSTSDSGADPEKSPRKSKVLLRPPSAFGQLEQEKVLTEIRRTLDRDKKWMIVGDFNMSYNKAETREIFRVEFERPLKLTQIVHHNTNNLEPLMKDGADAPNRADFEPPYSFLYEKGEAQTFLNEQCGIHPGDTEPWDQTWAEIAKSLHQKLMSMDSAADPKQYLRSISNDVQGVRMGFELASKNGGGGEIIGAFNGKGSARDLIFLQAETFDVVDWGLLPLAIGKQQNSLVWTVLTQQTQESRRKMEEKIAREKKERRLAAIRASEKEPREQTPPVRGNSPPTRRERSERERDRYEPDYETPPDSPEEPVRSNSNVNFEAVRKRRERDEDDELFNNQDEAEQRSPKGKRPEIIDKRPPKQPDHAVRAPPNQPLIRKTRQRDDFDPDEYFEGEDRNHRSAEPGKITMTQIKGSPKTKAPAPVPSNESSPTPEIAIRPPTRGTDDEESDIEIDPNAGKFDYDSFAVDHLKAYEEDSDSDED